MKVANFEKQIILHELYFNSVLSFIQKLFITASNEMEISHEVIYPIPHLLNYLSSFLVQSGKRLPLQIQHPEIHPWSTMSIIKMHSVQSATKLSNYSFHIAIFMIIVSCIDCNFDFGVTQHGLKNQDDRKGPKTSEEFENQLSLNLSPVNILIQQEALHFLRRHMQEFPGDSMSAPRKAKARQMLHVHLKHDHSEQRSYSL